jgi:hypothetical protein
MRGSTISENCFMKLELRSWQYSDFGWSWTIGFRFMTGTEIFVFFVGSDSGPAKPPIQWVLTAHIHLVPRLRIFYVTDLHPLPHSSSWNEA